MQLHEFQFEAFNTTIYGCYVRPENPKGVVVLVHGFAEHSGRYLQKVVPALLALDLAVVLYDNIGHGKSGGKRGHCPSYDALQQVLGKVINRAVDLFPNVPLFLYGHSMGGNLVLNYALRNDIALGGMVVTSPYLRLAFQPPKWKMVLGKLMLHILPSITLASGLDPNGISRIPEAVEKYKADPLVFDQVSPMYSLPIMEAGEWAIAQAGNLMVDTLLLHGAADPIIDYRATEEFHAKAEKTTLKLFPGGYHELHHDLCGDEMIAVVASWLKNKL